MWPFHYSHRKLQWRHLRGRPTNVNGWPCQESTPFWIRLALKTSVHSFIVFLQHLYGQLNKSFWFIWKEQQQLLTSSCSFSVSAAGPVRAARLEQIKSISIKSAELQRNRVSVGEGGSSEIQTKMTNDESWTTILLVSASRDQNRPNFIRKQHRV